MTALESRSTADPDRGLTAAEAAARRDAGLANVVTASTGRSYRAIVAANVFTRFNAILGGLLVVIIAVGPWKDGLFGIVLVVNCLIGIVQEVRAKRTLERLTLLSAASARVVRDGAVAEVPAEQIVQGDVVQVARGDEIVVDGTVVRAAGLEVDESQLTGESVPVRKEIGDPVRSGSFVVAGDGRHTADQVGDDAFAHRLAAEGKAFAVTRSELRGGIDRILQWVTWLLLPAAALLIWSQLGAHTDLREALRSSVAGVGAMIPEGLVLLTSTALAVGTIRLGRRKVLVQELGALEGLARVDVLCLDKTGTITEDELDVVEAVILDEAVDAKAVLGGLAAAEETPNPTLRAVGRWAGGSGWAAEWRVPFSSARKWSAAGSRDGGGWALGAADILSGWVEDPSAAADLRSRIEDHAHRGRRVLLLGWYPASGPEDEPAGRLRPAALLALEESIREDAPPTIRWFADQGVRLKVLSGDDPRTVGAIAARAGLAGAAAPVDARAVPDAGALAELVEETSVFGRVTPEDKRDIIDALHANGHTVAMVGDGVNDVLALKRADLGVAMGDGAPAARSVAQVVLLDPRFASLPDVVGEGRRVIGNVERVANLFLTKTVYAFVLAVAIGALALPFPFLPRHLTIISSLTIGIPGFFLALAATQERARPGFASRVLRFAVPAGSVAAAATLFAYQLARDDGVSTEQARTVATIALFGVALTVLAILARPVRSSRMVLLLAMALLFGLAFVVPGARSFFELSAPRALVVMATIGVIAVASSVLEAGWRAAGWASEHWHQD